MQKNKKQLQYYIALGAPPTRSPAEGGESFMRPEVGFNPSWFTKTLDIDFSEKWHHFVIGRNSTGGQQLVGALDELRISIYHRR